MSKKCIYCKTGIDEGSVIDFCKRCGVGVWGEKMFQAIVNSMESARDSGDLYQGSVTDPHVSRTNNKFDFKSQEKPRQSFQQSTPQQSSGSKAITSLAQEAVQNPDNFG